MTPQQLRTLREGLPAFPGAQPPNSLQRAFCRFYGIDFEDRLPGVEYRLGTVSSDAHILAVHRWTRKNARSNLLLVHGYFDHSGLFAKLIEHGLSRGCNVVIFDLPGHGLSSGEPAAIDDFADYGHAIHVVLEAAQLPALPLWVMAQSTGCAALVEYARHYSWPFAAAVLLAPLLRPVGWRWARLSHSILRPFTRSIERKFAPNSTDPEFLRFLRRDPLQSRRLSMRWVTALRNWIDSLSPQDLGVGPALIVQGDADHTLDWRYNVGFYCELFPGSSLKMLAGAGHQLANESPVLRQIYLDSVACFLSDTKLPLNGSMSS